MNINKELKGILNELGEKINNVNKEIDELVYEEDKNWRDKLYSSYNSDYSYRKIISEAKKKRSLIIDELSNNSKDSSKQVSLAKKLVSLNEVIAMYEEEFKVKEERKSVILDNKVEKIGSLLKESLNKSIELIDSNINELKNEEEEILSTYISSEDKSNNLLKLNEINNNIKELSNKKEKFEKLLSYNGTILINDLTGDDVIDSYYKLIMKYGIKMNQKYVKDDKDDYDDSLEIATKLVEKAEKTKDENDIKDAFEVVNKLEDSDEKDELVKRLNSIKLDDVKEFIILLDKINNDIAINNKVDKNDVVELRKKYQELNDIDASKYAKNVEDITTFYNNQYENKLKSKIDETDIEKHSISDYIIETLGKPISLLLGTSLVKKINNKRLAKKQEKYDNASEDDKESKLNKLNKVKKTIGDMAVVSGVKLFKNRNKINKLKPKLYHDDLTEKQEQKLEKAQDNFDALMLKGLDKKVNDSYNLSNKEGILNIFNQCLENMSITKDYEKMYTCSCDLLRSINENAETKKLLNEEEIRAFLDQLNIIRNYREQENAIYEYDSSDLYDVIKYYDEDVKLQKHELTYMK